MKQLGTFLALVPADRLLLVEAFAAVLGARVGLSIASVRRLRRWAAHRGSAGRPVARVIWAVGAACRRVPGATCLVSSLALQRVLSRHGHASVLHIGVARKGGRFAAHAWIVCAGEIYDGAGLGETYTRLVAWRASDTA